MLREAGIGVAVANSSKNAIQAADIMTKKTHGEGFIEITEKLLKEKLKV